MRSLGRTQSTSAFLSFPPPTKEDTKASPRQAKQSNVPGQKHNYCSNIVHKKARNEASTEPEAKKTGDKLQKLFSDFTSLDQRQVRDMGDDEALECYCLFGVKPSF